MCTDLKLSLNCSMCVCASIKIHAFIVGYKMRYSKTMWRRSTCEKSYGTNIKSAVCILSFYFEIVMIY